MHRRLLHLGRDETTSREHEIRIGLAITVLKVESAEEDGGRGDGDLAELKAFAEFLDQVGEPYSKTVELA